MRRYTLIQSGDFHENKSVCNDESCLAVNVTTKSLEKAVCWDKVHWTVFGNRFEGSHREQQRTLAEGQYHAERIFCVGEAS